MDDIKFMNEIVIERHQHVGVIQFKTDKMNVLSYSLRADLYQGIRQILDDSTVQSIVLIGTEHCFSAGADITEFSIGTHIQFPSLHDLIDLISDAPKPIIAAISGVALGGGLELALACHYRVVHQQAKLALPEVNLGLLPGAGGTQLLPRYIGPTLALDNILSGKPFNLTSLKDTALIDVLTQDDVKQAAIAFAQTCSSTLHIKHQMVNLEDDLKVLLAEKRQTFAHKPEYLAQAAIVEAIEAATSLDFVEGSQKEQSLFQQLAQSEVSQALRHAFLAEREVKNIPNLDPKLKAKAIQNVAIIGAGTMGSGIAICFLQAGYHVTLIDNQLSGLERGQAIIQQHFNVQIEKGRLSEDKVHHILTNLTTSLDYDVLSSMDLALEAVFEDLDLKKQVLEKMDQYLPADAILASNTSTLDLNVLAQHTKRPAAVVGLHFFSPAQIMPLLEVIRTNHTDDITLVTALEIAKRLRKISVVAGVCDGFIGNRMVNEYLRVAGLLVDAGASPYEIDAALEQWGMAMGPFRMCDLAGNDTGDLIRKQQKRLYPHKKFSNFADQLVAAQRFGQKTQKGWYDYRGGQRKGQPDPEVLVMLESYRQEKGITTRHFSADDIVARCIYALANEGFRLLEEGIALRSSDIDVVYLAGYGFPRWRGGPMFYAKQQGLNSMIAHIEAFALDPAMDSTFWQVPNLLAKTAA